MKMSCYFDHFYKEKVRKNVTGQLPFSLDGYQLSFSLNNLETYPVLVNMKVVNILLKIFPHIYYLAQCIKRHFSRESEQLKL